MNNDAVVKDPFDTFLPVRVTARPAPLPRKGVSYKPDPGTFGYGEYYDNVLNAFMGDKLAHFSDNRAMAKMRPAKEKRMRKLLRYRRWSEGNYRAR